MSDTRVAIDPVGVADRAKRFQTRSIKKTSKLGAMELALSMVDLTTLEGADTPGKVRQLCRKGLMPDPSDPTLPHVAAICVYPSMVATAHEILAEQVLNWPVWPRPFPAASRLSSCE